MPAPGEPERPGPCPGVAAGPGNRPLRPSAVVTIFRMSDRLGGSREGLSCPRSHSFRGLRPTKPSRAGAGGWKGDVDRRQVAGILLDSFPRSAMRRSPVVPGFHL